MDRDRLARIEAQLVALAERGPTVVVVPQPLDVERVLEAVAAAAPKQVPSAPTPAAYLPRVQPWAAPILGCAGVGCTAVIAAGALLMGKAIDTWVALEKDEAPIQERTAGAQEAPIESVAPLDVPEADESPP